MPATRSTEKDTTSSQAPIKVPTRTSKTLVRKTIKREPVVKAASPKRTRKSVDSALESEAMDSETEKSGSKVQSLVFRRRLTTVWPTCVSAIQLEPISRHC